MEDNETIERKTICEQFIEEYQKREELSVFRIIKIEEEQYNLIPNRYITQHEYEIFCKMLKKIIA
jgi:hypothetical protein